MFLEVMVAFTFHDPGHVESLPVWELIPVRVTQQVR